MQHQNNNFNPEHAKYILTLRYNPHLNSPLPPKIPNDITPSISENYEEHVKTLIEKSIMDNLQKEKKISLSLSGGIDSTLVFGLIKKLMPDLEVETISVKFSNSVDETMNASKIATHYKSPFHIISIENYLEELPKAISIVKQPFWDLHWYYVVKKAKTLSSTLVSGDGGDELFGGYTFRYEKFLSLIEPESTPHDKIQAYLQCHERDHVSDQDDIFNDKMNFSWENIYEILMPFFNNKLSPIDQVFLADYNGKLLYNFSIISKNLSNYFSLNTFSPLLSSELIEFTQKIPNERKYNIEKKIGKIILRNMLDQLGLSNFVSQNKLGFSINTKNYWKMYGQKICKNYLVESKIVLDGWINKNWINKYIDKENLDINYVNKFLGLLSFEIWYRIFITKDFNPNQKLDT
ncbi:asparagine synthase [Nitrosopumilus sp. b1]|uniref:asparagine synthase C-terminal domain-containing protein n=1 Tax=Nitrosopumilus sp. b1 TaxID=2109907 RepID=UPI0015F458A4|nr:asparagine synthase C-terminal domain-containing protein [Nitrosopumilus sp. b1]KAF6242275.1 asparagine synthase [Nitrosopumilus sp. b1]